MQPHETLGGKTPDQKTRLFSGPEETPLPKFQKAIARNDLLGSAVGLLKDIVSIAQEPMKEFLSTRRVQIVPISPSTGG